MKSTDYGTSPNVYIIAGPNGSGKTTFAKEFLPIYADCTKFANADLIAKGVSPFSPQSAAIRAGRIMLDEIDLFARHGEDFGFETTLSGQTHLKMARGLRERGYKIHMLFLWLSTVELALARVRGRVMKGGHEVSAPIVRRRFEPRSAISFGITVICPTPGCCLTTQVRRRKSSRLRRAESSV
ncbi:MAG TPA: zeta toxin family protein [Terriglobia bacterium]|nr:zeta toxin family protein [Terriglobia bacterium]